MSREMSRRPTPETEAAILASEGQWSFVLKETCQRLERERDEARVQYRSTEALGMALVKTINELKAERDEARALLERKWHGESRAFVEGLQ